ncbi:membrane dipeptidase [Silvibacterium bohemicum]|uniref:Membrane dipeptidase n=1 Tax=Silvibacterium bohemicum TaxID=1577686 RepID=A0A841K3P3_9BACT|nr:dipeptidase [Silvibacterium bohemicum]MBB6146559.1 membrane dipeptidase [Silvibacterium bohemicum]
MKKLAAILIATSLSLTAQTRNAPVNPKTAEAIHNSAIVIDTHADTPQRMLDENYDLADPLNGGQLNFESAKKGNLGAEFFSIWVQPELYKDHEARRTLELIDSVYQAAAEHPDKMEMAFTADDIEKAHRDHKLAALMGIEGGHSIENSLGLLRDYYRLGVRYMTLTWSNSLDWANSSGDIGKPGAPHNPDGLTPFGKEVVLEMNRLGMMVDISHVADDTFWAAIKTSKAPVIASHSAARALNDAPRNMTDEMLHAVAKNGGVVQVNYYSGFLSAAYREAASAQEAEVKQAIADFKAKYAREGKQVAVGDLERLQRSYADRIPRPPFSLLIDHIDHIAKVAGVDHVGLGSDFDGVYGQVPQGLDSPADLPKITAALLERGYSAEDCRKILGGNLLRVMRDVERVSREMQSGK